LLRPPGFLPLTELWGSGVVQSHISNWNLESAHKADKTFHTDIGPDAGVPPSSGLEVIGYIPTTDLYLEGVVSNIRHCIKNI
jgi:hypothetical protein